MVVLEVAPETVPREQVRLRGRSPFAGATIVNLSPAVAEELKVDTNATGVVVYDVEDNSPAAAAGFRPGDVILEVNNEKVARTGDLNQLTASPQRGWRVTVSRGGRSITAVLRG